MAFLGKTKLYVPDNAALIWKRFGTFRRRFQHQNTKKCFVGLHQANDSDPAKHVQNFWSASWETNRISGPGAQNLLCALVRDSHHTTRKGEKPGMPGCFFSFHRWLETGQADKGAKEIYSSSLCRHNGVVVRRSLPQVWAEGREMFCIEDWVRFIFTDTATATKIIPSKLGPCRQNQLLVITSC